MEDEPLTIEDLKSLIKAYYKLRRYERRFEEENTRRMSKRN